ncbi:MAG: hypothetical protein Q9168_002330 [Polycauliona sp. 1 TL-2023]
MADYHDALRKLEELAETRLELINSGNRYVGIEKAINVQTVQLHAKPSITSKAEQYARRLRQVKEQLGSYIAEDMDILIATQDSLVSNAVPSNTSKLRVPQLPFISRYWSKDRAKSTPPTTAKPHVKWKDEVPPLVATAQSQNVTCSYHKTSPHRPTSSSAKKPVFSTTKEASSTTPPVTPVKRPAPLYVFVNSITTREMKYANKTTGQPFQIRVGGDKTNEDSSFSHQVFSSPEKIGVVLWSRESNLIVVHSKNYIQYITGDVLHIEAMDDVEALRFAEHMQQRYGGGDVKVLESNGRYLSDTFARGAT